MGSMSCDRYADDLGSGGLDSSGYTVSHGGIGNAPVRPPTHPAAGSPAAREYLYSRPGPPAAPASWCHAVAHGPFPRAPSLCCAVPVVLVPHEVRQGLQLLAQRVLCVQHVVQRGVGGAAGHGLQPAQGRWVGLGSGVYDSRCTKHSLQGRRRSQPQTPACTSRPASWERVPAFVTTQRACGGQLAGRSRAGCSPTVKVLRNRATRPTGNALP